MFSIIFLRSANAFFHFSFLQIGEKVELVLGYERFGDAVSGPLLPGNRGTIIELQGAQGLRYVTCRASLFRYLVCHKIL